MLASFIFVKVTDIYILLELVSSFTLNSTGVERCGRNGVSFNQQVESLYDSLKGISRYADETQSGNEALAEAFIRVRNKEEVTPIAKVLVESYFGKWNK